MQCLCFCVWIISLREEIMDLSPWQIEELFIFLLQIKIQKDHRGNIAQISVYMEVRCCWGSFQIKKKSVIIFQPEKL